METIKIKTALKKGSEVVLDIDTIKKDNDELIVNLKTPTKLNQFEIVYFQRFFNDDRAHIVKSSIRPYRIKRINKEKNELVFEFPYRKDLFVTKITFPNSTLPADDSLKENYKVTFSDDIDILQDDFCLYDGVEFDGKKKHLSKKLVLESTDQDGENYTVNDFFIYGDENFNEESQNYRNLIRPNEVYCKKFNTDIIVGSKVRFYGTEFFYTLDGTEYFPFKDSTRLFYSESFMTIPIKLNNDYAEGLNQEMLIRHDLVQRIKEESIPEFIDMEKQVYHPYYVTENGIRAVEKIIINPHFREHTLDGWNTRDELYWNQFDKESFGFPADSINRSDSLLSMGFEIDDVLNKKKKLAKSFFRISFYDSPTPLGSMLLSYSTVFLNANEFFSQLVKYSKELFDSNKNKTEIDKIFAEHIRCRCEIRSRNYFGNSSEGFYAYLFPEEEANKSDSRTIYMKIEFNHAGVGRTIPFIFLKDDAIGPPLDFVSENPINPGDNTVDMKAYFESLYLPVVLKYNEVEKVYMYIFPKGLVNEDNALELNIFEPRVNRTARL